MNTETIGSNNCGESFFEITKLSNRSPRGEDQGKLTKEHAPSRGLPYRGTFACNFMWPQPELIHFFSQRRWLNKNNVRESRFLVLILSHVHCILGPQIFPPPSTFSLPWRIWMWIQKKPNPSPRPGHVGKRSVDVFLLFQHSIFWS